MKGFYFDQEACIGCHVCQVACKDRNDLPVGVNYREVRSYESGVFPNAQIFHLSAGCNHCANPACVAACPTGAMYADAADGTVQHDDGACIGCGTCAAACPYQVPVVLESGVAAKCDACKPLREAGMNPVCVDACPMRCLHFGELEELAAEFGADAVRELPMTPAASETDPSTLIRAKEAAFGADWRVALI